MAKTILDIVPAGICSPDQAWYAKTQYLMFPFVYPCEMEKHFNFYADYYGTFGSSLPLLSVHQDSMVIAETGMGQISRHP